MAEDFYLPESTTVYNVKGQLYRASPGSESMACNQSNQVNVGDPDSSSREVLADKPNQQGSQDGCQEVRRAILP